MIESIKKRDGRIVAFDLQKIMQAIEKSFLASGSRKGSDTAQQLTESVIAALESDENVPSVPTVEQVQDAVERILIEHGFVRSAKAYILYRAERSRVREMNTHLMKTFEDICFFGESDEGSGAPMGSIQKFGSESAKQFYELFVLDPKYATAHRDGDIHIHDLEYYTLTTAGTQIDLCKLLQGGFTAGRAALCEPQDIISASAQCCTAIQANQTDQHGGQSIANFGCGMAASVKKTYARHFGDNLARALELISGMEDAQDKAKSTLDDIFKETGKAPELTADRAFDKALKAKLQALGEAGPEQPDRIAEFAHKHAESETDTATHQAMEALVHTLNTTQSSAPLPCLNYGLDTSPEGRMAVRSLLLATEEGLGSGDTPAAPVQIFRVKEGVNYTPGNPNYDLFRLAVRVSAKRGMPQFAFLDAPFHRQYYKKGDYAAQAAYAGNHACVMGNVHDPKREIAPQRGSLFTTSVNLPRIALKSKGDVTWFFEELERVLSLIVSQLLERFEIIGRKKAADFPFLMGQGLWLDSETLKPGSSIREVLKHGSLVIGFAGLAETLTVLRGVHHGENAASQNLGLEIVSFIRKYTDEMSEQHRMNFTCFAAPADTFTARFAALDAERFGTLKGITDHEAYTDSFHVPADCACTQPERLALEAPYHALTNGGHISFARVADDPQKHLDTVEKLLRSMHDLGIGCGAVTGK